MTKQPIILFRGDFGDDARAELTLAQAHMPVTESRVGLDERLVIGRYSVLPFYQELERDLEAQGSTLANTTRQHRFVADFHWYDVLKDLTPRTWFDLVSLPKDGGPFVVKGLTNSRKFEWKQRMFAPTYADVLRITTELGQDGLIGPQGLVYREFVPLKVLEVGLNDLPFANEWRFFFWGTDLLAHGFYWTATEKRAPISDLGIWTAKEAAKRIAPHVNFFVVDVAETADGRWIVIEVNDGQMSGLSDCDADELYENLAIALGVVEPFSRWKSDSDRLRAEVGMPPLEDDVARFAYGEYTARRSSL